MPSCLVPLVVDWLLSACPGACAVALRAIRTKRQHPFRPYQPTATQFDQRIAGDVPTLLGFLSWAVAGAAHRRGKTKRCEAENACGEQGRAERDAKTQSRASYGGPQPVISCARTPDRNRPPPRLQPLGKTIGNLGGFVGGICNDNGWM